MRPIKYCTSKKPYCNARIKHKRYSLCCAYGWCDYAQPSQDRKGKAVCEEREETTIKRKWKNNRYI